MLLAGLSYGALTGEAVGPDFGPVAAMSAREATATLSYSGANVIITGSVESMFESLGTFVGPNRAEKRNRERIEPDVLAVVRGFDEVRVRLAALRAGPLVPDGLAQSRFADASPDLPIPEEAPRISVASINPALLSPALTAIDSIAPGLGVPVPLSVPDQIAYARANAPVTTFEVTNNGKVVSEKELWCLATAIYFEARGESYRGQVAVAQVVMNRVAHKLYPNTICGVVYQNQTWRNRCQFSFACDGIPERTTDRKSWAQAQDIAKQVAGGSLYLTEVADATHYHATYVYPHWAPRLKRLTKVGMHIFYRFKRG